MYSKIGEPITLPDGRKVEAVESDGSCNGCVIAGTGLCRNIRCKAAERVLNDRKNIIYKEIKEE